MSYIVIKIYSFECDRCDATYDVTPRPDKPVLLRSAQSELRYAGWAVHDGKHYCPKHKPGEAVAAKAEAAAADAAWDKPGEAIPLADLED
jgi:hypothetical protein